MEGRLEGMDRWLGVFIGLLVAGADVMVAGGFGLRFEINGRSVTWWVWGYLGCSFGGLGFLVGYLLELRRRERELGRQMQEQAQKQFSIEARLSQAEKLSALGQMAATIAHEVRNPLAIIRSAVQNLEEGLPDDDDESHESCEFVLEEIDRLTHVTSSLLQFVRPIQLRPELVELREVFARISLLTRRLLREKDIEWRLGSLEGARLEVDVDLLSQVLLGLISNAIDALPEGGEISLGVREEGEFLELLVEDSGAGIPEELRERVFEPMFTTRKEGNGFGLAIARQIIEAHGGEILVEESPLGGARFVIRLSAVQRQARAA